MLQQKELRSMEKATIDKLLLSNIYIVVLATLLLFTKGKTFVESSSSSSSHPNDTATSCVAGERSALVDFKAGLRDPAYLLSSWKGDDCCKWKGVHCSTKNSHVVKLDLPGHGCDYNDVDMMMQVLGGNISSSLLGLQHLQYLNLSCNEFYGVQIPEFLGSLHKLRYIDLSRSTFSGRIPPQLGNLSNLRYLNLGRADYTYSMDITWLARLTSLEYLDLSGTNLSTIVHWLPVVNMLPSLNVLSLRSCNLRTGSASLHLSNLTFLEALDLSFNSFHRHITPNWFWELTSLKYLYIARSGFYGQFPEEIGNMTSIVELYLSSNYLVGMVPSNLKNLCSLQKFDVSNNNMSGSITEFFLRLPRCSWNKLTYMYQRSSNSTAILPTKLEPLSNLTYLSLGSNNLTGHVPLLIGKLTKLIYLDLSYNNLEGFIHEGHLSGLKSLESLWLSNLTLTMNLWWVPPSNLTDISLQSCLLGPKFPLWLRRIKRLEYLDISNTGISDTMPDWFWILASTAVALNMRQNKISGSLPPTMEFMTATAIGLSSNQFNGPIPKLPMSLNDLDLSENNFDGPLPLDFGAPNLETLILFDNSISGTIPSSLCKLRSLRLLDISDNKLTGSIPNCSADTSTTSKTSMSIINLSLRNNNLSGEFPSFLQYCEELVFLDLAHNHFFGTLPAWIREKLPYLAFLRLRSNSFYGHIPEELTKLDNLRYLDLAYNNITGSIPKSIVNWKEMTIVTDDYDDLSALHAAFNFGLGWTENDFTDIFTYTENFAVVTKGQERLYTGEIIYMVILDLSCNNLMGDIPEEIHRLVKLKNLNLSWNTFSGKIPVNIGALAQVESLDLSHNELSGEIPASLSDLTSLSRLNLSYNNLTGEVPSGDQLQTLEDPEYIYIGNPGLCGPSLLRKCLQPEPIPNTPEDHEDLNDMASFFIAMGSGYVMGIWVVFCTFLFKRKWRVRWYSICDGCYDWVYVQAAVTWASWTRKIFTKAESGR